MSSSNRYPNDPKMVIYQIYNKSNGKSYVGQAKNGFFRRYGSYSWWKYVKCTYLKNSINKYGKDAFKVCILERDVASEEELNRLEIEHIKRLNCTRPNGYNHQSGGQMQSNRKHHPETGNKIALCRSGGKVYRLLNNKTGVIHEFVNIDRFAKENGLSGPMLTILLSGKRSVSGHGPYYSQHKEWSLPDKPIQKTLCTSPEGDKYIVLDGVDGGIKGFCEQIGVAKGSALLVRKGKYKQARGWVFNIIT